jgi:hypothetical protein
MEQRPIPAGEKPRVEPEIIPPGDAAARWGGSPDWSSGATHRVYVAKIGPFGFFLIALAVAALAVLVLVLILGAFLLWIPIAGLLLAAAVLSGLLRGRRLR